tara:strand:+ start:184 stop:717 length:534 start_codon:yes stop_codon:yes gene_type:complete
MQIEAIINEQKKLVTNLDETTAKVKELKLDIEMITKDNELSYQELRRNSNYNTKNNGKNTKENLAASMEDIEEEDDDNSSNKEYEKIEEEEEILVQRIDSLEESIQRAAQKRINKRYVISIRSNSLLDGFICSFVPCLQHDNVLKTNDNKQLILFVPVIIITCLVVIFATIILLHII